MQDLPLAGSRQEYGWPRLACDIRPQSRDRRRFRLLGCDEEIRNRLGRRHADKIPARAERHGPRRQDGVSRHQGRSAARRPPGLPAPGDAIDAGGAAVSEATIIDGKAIAGGLRQRVAEAAAELRGHRITAGLAAILVGDDPASQLYVRSKARACAEAGIASFEHRLPGECGAASLLELVARLNRDDRVDGILVQLPLPRGIDPLQVMEALDPAKDVD